MNKIELELKFKTKRKRLYKDFCLRIYFIILMLVQSSLIQFQFHYRHLCVSVCLIPLRRQSERDSLFSIGLCTFERCALFLLCNVMGRRFCFK